MKTKKVDYSTLSQEDLFHRLKNIEEEKRSAYLKFRLGQFKKTSEFSRLRKEIAQIKTLLRLKELGINEA